MGRHNQRKKERKEFYAVLEGRDIEEPTIFPSWADAHPRVTGHTGAVHKGFATLEEARKYMRNHGVPNPLEIAENGVGSSAPVDGSTFYAVAHGRRPGVYTDWWGDGGAEEQVNGVRGSCYEAFRTEDQAEAFIEDWKRAYLEVVRDMFRVALDRGDRPHGIKDLGFGELENFIGRILYQPAETPKVK